MELVNASHGNLKPEALLNRINMHIFVLRGSVYPIVMKLAVLYPHACAFDWLFNLKFWPRDSNGLKTIQFFNRNGVLKDIFRNCFLFFAVLLLCSTNLCRLLIMSTC